MNGTRLSLKVFIQTAEQLDIVRVFIGAEELRGVLLGNDGVNISLSGCQEIEIGRLLRGNDGMVSANLLVVKGFAPD